MRPSISYKMSKYIAATCFVSLCGSPAFANDSTCEIGFDTLAMEVSMRNLGLESPTPNGPDDQLKLEEEIKKMKLKISTEACECVASKYGAVPDTRSDEEQNKLMMIRIECVQTMFEKYNPNVPQ